MFLPISVCCLGDYCTYLAVLRTNQSQHRLYKGTGMDPQRLVKQEVKTTIR